MNKLRVIDLLNKIANGEELPDKIYYDGNDYKLVEYGETTKLYQCLSEPYELFNINTDRLNEEVEIIGDKKIPEKLGCSSTDLIEAELIEKINEIIDYLEEKQC